MKHATALLYIVTGLAVICSDVAITGTMLGMASPIFSAERTLIGALFFIGPSMLILVGLTTSLTRSRRSLLCLLTAGVILGLLGLWTVPPIGWSYASRLFLIPGALSLFIAGILVVWIEKRWISAALASVLSAPFFVCGSAYLAYGTIFGQSRPVLASIWIFVPALLAILSFTAAVCFRIN